jgi:hypothetical protein
MSDELDGVRIRRLAAERRAILRSRSHCIIAGVVCVVLEWQLCWMIVEQWAKASSLRMLVYALAACAIAIIAALCGHRAVELTGQLRRPLIEEPASPPDFSTLGDGSQQAKNLEEIHD